MPVRTFGNLKTRKKGKIKALYLVFSNVSELAADRICGQRRMFATRVSAENEIEKLSPIFGRQSIPYMLIDFSQH